MMFLSYKNYLCYNLKIVKHVSGQFHYTSVIDVSAKDVFLLPYKKYITHVRFHTNCLHLVGFYQVISY